MANIRNYETEADRVKRGAAFMDKILPGWHRKVNLKKLQMENSAMCLLGQTFGVHHEESLAREMYPEEFAESFQQTFGMPVEVASNHTRSFGYLIGLGAIPKIMRKLDMVDYADFYNLTKVCGGHDNKCEWAGEVAARIAADEVTPEVTPDGPQ